VARYHHYRAPNTPPSTLTLTSAVNRNQNQKQHRHSTTARCGAAGRARRCRPSHTPCCCSARGHAGRCRPRRKPCKKYRTQPCSQMPLPPHSLQRRSHRTPCSGPARVCQPRHRLFAAPPHTAMLTNVGPTPLVARPVLTTMLADGAPTTLLAGVTPAAMLADAAPAALLAAVAHAANGGHAGRYRPRRTPSCCSARRHAGGCGGAGVVGSAVWRVATGMRGSEPQRHKHVLGAFRAVPSLLSCRASSCATVAWPPVLCSVGEAQTAAVGRLDARQQQAVLRRRPSLPLFIHCGLRVRGTLLASNGRQRGAGGAQPERTTPYTRHGPPNMAPGGGRASGGGSGPQPT